MHTLLEHLVARVHYPNETYNYYVESEQLKPSLPIVPLYLFIFLSRTSRVHNVTRRVIALPVQNKIKHA